MELTTLIVLLAVALVVMAIVVGALVVRLIHKNNELKEKNDVIVREVRRNQRLIDRAVQQGVSRAAMLSVALLCMVVQGAWAEDVNYIYYKAVDFGNHAGITCLGDATIVINTTNKYDATSVVRSFGSGYPAIKPGGMGSTLTIKGNSGRLQAYGGANATAIGGSSNLSCGNILISGGTVEATGGTGAPAIGNYGINSCGTITIDNTVARVTATKGSGATNSIGFAGSAFGSCGTVTIGGTVYWDGSAYQNGGEVYLATSPLTYQP